MTCNDLPPIRLLMVVLLIALFSAACTTDQSDTQTSSSEMPEGELEEKMPSEYEQAVQAYRDSDYAAALDHVNAAIVNEPVTVEMYNLQGSIYQQMDDQETAVKSFTNAIELDANHADSYNNRALSRQALGDEEGAESDFRKAIQLDQSFGLAHYNLGILLYAKMDYSGANAELEEATRLLPTDSDVWFQLGLTYDRIGQADNAIHAFSQTIDIEQGFDDQSYYLRGILYAEQGNYEQAEADFNEAIKKGLRSADTLFYRGLMRYYREDYPAALEDLKQAVDYEPQNAEAHYYLSFIYARLDDQVRAREHAQKALELDPPVDHEVGGQ